MIKINEILRLSKEASRKYGPRKNLILTLSIRIFLFDEMLGTEAPIYVYRCVT